jgi:hypothetical protein
MMLSNGPSLIRTFDLMRVFSYYAYMVKTVKCSRCRQLKPLSEFSPRKNGKRNYYCKKCRVDYQREWLARPGGMKKHAAYAKRRRTRLRALVAERKQLPCADCEKTYPSEVMELDHVRGKKLLNVAMLVSKNMSEQTILDEMDKCDVVCANCHRIRTISRRNEARRPK